MQGISIGNYSDVPPPEYPLAGVNTKLTLIRFAHTGSENLCHPAIVMRTLHCDGGLTSVALTATFTIQVVATFPMSRFLFLRFNPINFARRSVHYADIGDDPVFFVFLGHCFEPALICTSR